MEKESLPTTRKIWATLFAALVFASIAGCAALFTAVAPENRISLQQETSSRGAFRYGDLSVQYSYAVDGAKITVNGAIDFRRSFDSLDVYLLVVDAAGRVIENSLVYSSGFRSAADRVEDFSFTKSLVLPADAMGISFTYAAQDRRSYQ